MFVTMSWVLSAVVGVASLVAAGWGLHRFCIALEERGYLYYRKSPEGGGGSGGVLAEMDRLARPSIQHVVEVSDERRRAQDEEEGENDG
jgi:hypothetical protein